MTRIEIPLTDEDVIILKKELVGEPAGYYFFVLNTAEAVEWAEWRDLPVDGDGVAVAANLLEEFKNNLDERGLTWTT